MLHLNKLTFFAFCVYILFTFSCTHDNTISQNQKELFELLEKEKTNYQSSFSIINQIADSYRYQNDNKSLILFLTDFVEKNPELAILEEEFALEEYAICISKETTELTAKINDALAQLQENGTLTQ